MARRGGWPEEGGSISPQAEAERMTHTQIAEFFMVP
jgi:hypothetical protein